MEAKAVWKFARISPRKVRLVADVIRGKKISYALDLVKYTNKKAAFMMEKVLKSALANAETSAEGDLNVDNVVVKEVFVDGGPMLKRFRPRAMGRANRIRKRTSHITVVLAEKQAAL